MSDLFKIVSAFMNAIEEAVRAGEGQEMLLFLVVAALTHLIFPNVT